MRYEFGGLIFGGAYTWRGLYTEGLIFGILRYTFATSLIRPRQNNRKIHFSSFLRVLVFAFFEDDESYTCYKCGKIFAYESYLERHVKYVCPDKTGRTWKCSYCSKAFQYPCYLRRHMRSHTGKNLKGVGSFVKA